MPSTSGLLLLLEYIYPFYINHIPAKTASFNVSRIVYPFNPFKYSIMFVCIPNKYKYVFRRTSTFFWQYHYQISLSRSF